MYYSIGFTIIMEMTMEEIWKDIPGYGGHYMASNLGRIKVKARKIRKFCGLHGKEVEQIYKERLLSSTKADKYGHMSVHLGVDKKKYAVAVHRLVLFAFVGYPPNGHEGCHNNGIASDNRIENLRWDTHANNNLDRKKHGKYLSGKDHPMYGTKMSDEHKAKLLSFHLGKKRSQEWIDNMAKGRKKNALQKQEDS
jgi:hypothetical protein